MYSNGPVNNSNLDAIYEYFRDKKHIGKLEELITSRASKYRILFSGAKSAVRIKIFFIASIAKNATNSAN